MAVETNVCKREAYHIHSDADIPESNYQPFLDLLAENTLSLYALSYPESRKPDDLDRIIAMIELSI